MSELRDRFSPSQIAALNYCLRNGWHALDDGFGQPRDANRKVIESVMAMLDLPSPSPHPQRTKEAAR